MPRTPRRCWSGRPGHRRADDVRARQRSKAPAGHASVSLRVDYDERAISQAAAFLDDPQGIRAVLDAIDRLADDPRCGRIVPRTGHRT